MNHSKKAKVDLHSFKSYCIKLSKHWSSELHFPIQAFPSFVISPYSICGCMHSSNQTAIFSTESYTFPSQFPLVELKRRFCCRIPFSTIHSFGADVDLSSYPSQTVTRLETWQYKCLERERRCGFSSYTLYSASRRRGQAIGDNVATVNLNVICINWFNVWTTSKGGPYRTIVFVAFLHFVVIIITVVVVVVEFFSLLGTWYGEFPFPPPSAALA